MVPYHSLWFLIRGGGTGGAGGAIAPPTFVILHSKQPLAPPTFLLDP